MYLYDAKLIPNLLVFTDLEWSDIYYLRSDFVQWGTKQASHIQAAPKHSNFMDHWLVPIRGLHLLVQLLQPQTKTRAKHSSCKQNHIHSLMKSHATKEFSDQTIYPLVN